MLREEGLPSVFARHAAARRSDAARGARLGARDPVPQSGRVQRIADGGDDARGPRRRRASREMCSSASTCRSAPGSGKLAGRVFRIGHLGYFNDLMLCGTLCGVEMGLALARRAAPQGRRAGSARVPGATATRRKSDAARAGPREPTTTRIPNHDVHEEDAAMNTFRRRPRIALAIAAGARRPPPRGSPRSPSRSSSPPAPAARPTRWRA